MYKPDVNTFTKRIIITFLIMAIIMPLFPIKQAKAGQLAEWIVHHIVIDGGKEEFLQRESVPPIDLDKGNIAIKDLAERAGYRYIDFDGENCTVELVTSPVKRFKVTLSSENTHTKPGILKIYYEKLTNSGIKVSVKGIVKSKDGSSSNVFHSTEYNGLPNTYISTKVPDVGESNWELVRVTMKVKDRDPYDVPLKDIKDPFVISQPRDTEIIYEYIDNTTGIMPSFAIHRLAVIIDENDKIIQTKDGFWEAERKHEGYYNVPVGKPFEKVQSPWVNGIPEEYKEFKYTGKTFIVQGIKTGEEVPSTGTVWDHNTATIVGGVREYSETVKIIAKSHVPQVYVYYIYKKGDVKPDPEPDPETGELGKIIFIPHETTWTNQGKTSNGQGSYPVTVRYTGSETITKNATYTWTEMVAGTDADGKPTSTPVQKSGTFPVTWRWEKIIVSGATNKTVYGLSGLCNINQEGYHQSLTGVGNYGPPQYTLPPKYDSYTLPQNPPTITGKSGYYDIDWTDPTTTFSVTPKIFGESNGARRGNSIKGIDQAYFGTLTTRDNLSGIAQMEVAWTFGSGQATAQYETIYSNPGTTHLRSSEVITREAEKPVGDDMYLHVKLRDVAGNTNYYNFGPYEDPIMLKNFKITDLKDTNWTEVFWKDWEKALDKHSYVGDKSILTEPTGFNYLVKDLPIDNNSNPIYKNIYPKRGYAFDFEITSEYLYRDHDRIVITPNFYAINVETGAREEVDVYYLDGKNPFTKIKSPDDKWRIYRRLEGQDIDIGTHSQLDLRKIVRTDKGRPFYKKDGNGWEREIQYRDGKLQTWYGQYLIPSTSKMYKKDVPPRPENLIEDRNLLINLTITAYKNGAETNSTNQTFSYVPGQWTKEGGPKNNKYQPGDIILYDHKFNRRDDLTTNVTH